MKENKMLNSDEIKKVSGGVEDVNPKSRPHKLSDFIEKIKNKNQRIKSKFINNNDVKPLISEEAEQIAAGVNNHESKSDILRRLRNPLTNISAPTKICGTPVPTDDKPNK